MTVSVPQSLNTELFEEEVPTVTPTATAAPTTATAPMTPSAIHSLRPAAARPS